MDIFEFVQKFFLILLPGVISSYVYEAINVRKEQHYYLEFLKIIVLSFISYFLADMTFGGIRYFFPCFIYGPIDIIQHIGTNNADMPTSNVLIAIVFGVVLACFLTKANYCNWFFQVANAMKLTRRVNSQCVWEHVFDQNNVVILRDSVTHNTYFGKVASFSDNSENREIYFENVMVFNENSEFLYHADGLYLSRQHNEFTIEIQNDAVQKDEE